MVDVMVWFVCDKTQTKLVDVHGLLAGDQVITTSYERTQDGQLDSKGGIGTKVSRMRFLSC